MDELILTKSDEMNYHAICAAIRNDPVVKRKRRSRDMCRLLKFKKLADQDFECYDCGVEFHSENGIYPDATFEHIIPFRFGSATNRHNVVVMCQSCNKKRDVNFNIGIIEAHFGPIDYTMIEHVPRLDLSPVDRSPHGRIVPRND